MFSGLKQKLLSFEKLIFPDFCQICFLPMTQEKLFCDTCFQDISHYEYKCHYCGFFSNSEQYFSFNDNISKCNMCANMEKPIFDSFHSAYDFDERVAKIIHNLKYYDKPNLAKLMAADIVKNLPQNYYAKDSIIVPVAMHKHRMLKRKYNQASFLSYYLAKELNLQFSNDAIVRVKNTKPQARQTAKARKHNLKNAFLVKRAALLSQRQVIVVDDVATTGSTLLEISRVLSPIVAKLHVITFARVDGYFKF